jgi:methylated-DNA-[protein]-cysteine S-methyltransferase
MTIYHTSFATPLGPFSVAVNETGAVVATAFGKLSALKCRLPECHLLVDVSRTENARRQIEEYFADGRRKFELKLAPMGTDFQQMVWSALRRIPFGKTESYGGLANRIKRPTAARAVGRANATNPICLIVPCHRVIGADGSLTGFAFGEKIKLALLAHEGSLRPAAV